MARLGEQPRRDESVTTVVARPAEHRNATPPICHAGRLHGDRLAGPLHEKVAARAGGDGAPVRLGHFVGREELDQIVADGPVLGRFGAHEGRETQRPFLAD